MLAINVNHQQGHYPIYIGENLLNNPSLLPVKAGDKVMIVSNPTVASHYLPTVRGTLESLGCKVRSCLLPDGEQYKTLEYLDKIYQALLSENYGRDCLLVALGGGVIGDITGLAAATYQRGVRFIQIPTTLLAQVDSSVGGKTAVNHPLGKNMIGAFYQPQAVIIDINTLQTLPPREFSAGFAEVLKYGIALDAEFLAWLETHFEAIWALSPDALKQTVARCCQLKAEIVARDEREKGERALLNFGHTFGHAIESQQGYGNWLHGEAVATGMLLALALSASNAEGVKKGVTSQDFQRIKTLLQRANLPVQPPEAMTAEQFLTFMQRDKKNLAGKIRLVLISTLGHSYVTSDVPESAIKATLSAFSQ